MDWYITYSSKVFRLDTKQIGIKGYAQNEIIVKSSDHNSGTKMTLGFHDLPTDITELKKLLDMAVEKEDFENACVLRDLIKEQN